MKITTILKYLFLVSSLIRMSVIAMPTLPSGYPDSPRQKQILINGWEFYLDTTSEHGLDQPPVGVTWQKVTVPHMPKMASIDLDECEDDHYQLTFHRWVAWYQRSLVVNAKSDERIYLELEGAHQVTTCWVNGTYVGKHSTGGYTPFHFDVTDYVDKNGKENQIVLSVDNRRNVNVPPDGDRYDYIKWSGLYRDVYLVVKNEMHVGFPWENTESGVFVSTPSVTKNDATVSVRTNVRNTSESQKNCRVLTRIIDDEGIVVLKLNSIQKIQPNSSKTFYQTGGLTEDVRLWSIEDPYLYRVNTVIYEDEKIVDCVENPLGLRRFDFVDGKGFLLNGKEVELIGVNRHQGMLFIGDAVPDSLHWKDAWQFKQAGFNSVRLAHYPHDNSFIEACDELGILVFEEPPTWIGIGGDAWMDNLEQATRVMVRNHRNHPSVLMWGAAINHRGPVERLHYACKEEDPTRPTASNGAPWTGPRNSGVCDIYAPMDYQNMPITPNEFTYLCEHGGSDDASRAQFEVSKSREMANMIGVALWTAHDYQSFKGRDLLYPRRPLSAYRIPNPSYYWYQSELTQKPMVYIADERASTHDQVVVFSNAQQVELYHDGQLVASQRPDRSPNRLYLKHPSFTFDYEWDSGTFVAKAYINHEFVAEDSFSTADQAKSIKLVYESDETPFYADGSSIKWVRAVVLDERGIVVSNSKNPVHFKVSGNGKLIADGVAGANPNLPYWGVASAMVCSGNNPGVIQVIASSDGLISGELEIETVSYEQNRILANAKPIYDLKHEQIDLCSVQEQVDAGKDGLFELGVSDQSISSQFLQFGWRAWVGDSQESKVYQSAEFDGCTLELVSDDPLHWYTGWGMVSELPYLAIDGVQVNARDSMVLKIRGLKKGSYNIKSFHHLSEAVNRAPGSLSIIVKDARAEAKVVESELRLTSGMNIFSIPPTSSEYSVYSNGTDPISITFSGVVDDIPVPLNGIVIKEKLN